MSKIYGISYTSRDFNNRHNNIVKLGNECGLFNTFKCFTEQDIDNEFKQKYKEDPLYNYKERCRAVLRNALKLGSYKITSKPYKLLGCSYDYFKTHIENQFTEGMNWDNRGEWHYDHIIPISNAKTEEEVNKLNHYTNFQPLWAKDNRFKSSKI